MSRHCTSKLADRHPRHPLARLSRRGAAVDRFGLAADHPLAHRRGRCCGRNRYRRRPCLPDPARRRQSRHLGRGARPVLRHAGAAEIHEGRARRKLGGQRRHQAHRDRLSGGPLHPVGQRPHDARPARDGRHAGGPLAADRAGHGGRVPRQLDRHRRRARRRAALRLRLDPLLHQGQRAAAICLCQRPAGARQADRRRDPRRVRRCPAARPACGHGAVPDARPGHGRRQRPPCQGRRALSRPRSRTRADRRRDPAGAGAIRRSRGNHGGGRHDGRLPAGRRQLRPSRPGQRPSQLRSFLPRLGAWRVRSCPLAAPAAESGLRRRRSGRFRRRTACQRRHARRQRPGRRDPSQRAAWRRARAGA